MTRTPPTDDAVAYVVREVNRLKQEVGIYLTPEDDIGASLGVVQAGETILLLPGEYYLSADLTINKSCTIQGIGRVVIRSLDKQILVTGSDVVLRNLELMRTEDPRTTPGATGYVSVSGNRCKVEGCLVSASSTYSIFFAAGAAYGAVVGCKFMPQAVGFAATSDIRFEDTATYGIVGCNMWSTTSVYVLDYLGVSNMTQDVNGPAAIINVR